MSELKSGSETQLPPWHAGMSMIHGLTFFGDTFESDPQPDNPFLDDLSLPTSCRRPREMFSQRPTRLQYDTAPLTGGPQRVEAAYRSRHESQPEILRRV